jgi:MFS family permease
MRGLGWALGGLVLGGAAALALSILAAWLGGISQAEGAYAMGVAFFWVPLGAVLGAISGVVLSRRK